MCVNVCLSRQKQLKRRFNCRCPNSFGVRQVFVLVLYYKAHHTAAESKLNKAKNVTLLISMTTLVVLKVAK